MRVVVHDCAGSTSYSCAYGGCARHFSAVQHLSVQRRTHPQPVAATGGTSAVGQHYSDRCTARFDIRLYRLVVRVSQVLCIGYQRRQLILPEPLKLLPLCTLGMIKHPLLQEGVSADERSYLYSFINSMPCYVSVAFVVPRHLRTAGYASARLHIRRQGRVSLPPSLSLSSESFSINGLYLLDDARFLYCTWGPSCPRRRSRWCSTAVGRYATDLPAVWPAVSKC